MMPVTMPATTDPSSCRELLSFEQFVASTRHFVMAAVATATGDVVGAEDAIQEAYGRAWTRWDRIGRMERPAAWVVLVATREAGKKRRKRKAETAMAPGLRAELADDVNRLWVRWHLAQLTPRQRAMVLLRHDHGLTIEEVATAMRRTPSTVRSYLERLRHRLREAIDEERTT